MTDLPFLLLRVAQKTDPHEERVGSIEDYRGLLSTDEFHAVCAGDRNVGLDDVASSASEFRDTKEGPIAFVVEYTSRASGSTLSYLCAQLHQVLDLDSVITLVVSVPSVKVLQETGILDHVYSPAMSVAILDETESFRLLTDGQLETAFAPIRRQPRLPPPAERIRAEELFLRFGHFSAELPCGPVHTNVLPNVEASRRHEDAWRRLVASTRADVETLAASQEYVLLPIEWAGGELERLALEVCGGVEKIVSPGGALPTGVEVCVSLSLAPISLETHRRIALHRGVPRTIAVRCLNIASRRGEVSAVVTLPPMAQSFFPWNCPYCEQDVPDEGTGVEHLMGPLHPKLFWDLVGWDEAHVQFKHWPSPTTPNHFNLKLETLRIFSMFGHSLAERMANTLSSKGLLPSWVDGLISTTGEEADTLVPHLAQRLGIEEGRILKVDTGARVLAERPGVDPDLAKWVASATRNGITLGGANLVIVDQAAHHLRTLSGLRKIAEAFHGRPLGFTVFVDRTGFSVEQLESLYHGLHFAPLYSWDCPPWKALECPCRRPVELLQ